MARFNRSIRPVNSLKHIVDTPTTAVPGGVATNVIIAQAVQNPLLAATTEVKEGSVINSIYLGVEAQQNGNSFSAVPRVYMIVVKNPGNEIVAPYPANAGASDAKRFVIHQEMQMHTANTGLDNSNTFPRTMFKGVIKIPRGYRRFGYNDRLIVVFALDSAESTGNINVCVQAIYKEFN